MVRQFSIFALLIFSAVPGSASVFYPDFTDSVDESPLMSFDPGELAEIALPEAAATIDELDAESPVADLMEEIKSSLGTPDVYMPSNNSFESADDGPAEGNEFYSILVAVAVLLISTAVGAAFALVRLKRRGVQDVRKSSNASAGPSFHRVVV